jgi:enoyl-CoA hydratase
VGGGLELVMACDLVVAAEHARFGLPEVKRGLYPAGGGTLLSNRIPQALALEIGLTGPLGVQLTKRLMRRAVDHGSDAGRATPEENQVVFRSEDAREGSTAFMEKRAATFRGR